MKNDSIASVISYKLKKDGIETAVICEETENIKRLSRYPQERTVWNDVKHSNVTITVQAQNKKYTLNGNCNSVDDAVILADRAVKGLSQYSRQSGPLPAVPVQSFRRNTEEASAETMIYRVNEAFAQTEKEYPVIKYRVFKLIHHLNKRTVSDLQGHTSSDTYGSYMLDCAFSAVTKTDSTSFDGFTMPFFKLDKPLLDVPDLRFKLENTVKQLYRSEKKASADVMVLDPNVLYMLLYQLIERQLGDNAVLTHCGKWQDKLNKQITDKALTLSFEAGEIPGIYLINQNGTQIKSQTIIENGTLRSFYLSEYGAKKSGYPAIANGENLCMTVSPGDSPLDLILSGIESGVYVSRISIGIPNINGEISCIAKNCLLIENGKLTRSIDGLNISGNLIEALQSIDKLSSDCRSTSNFSLPYLVTKKLHFA